MPLSSLILRFYQLKSSKNLAESIVFAIISEISFDKIYQYIDFL